MATTVRDRRPASQRQGRAERPAGEGPLRLEAKREAQPVKGAYIITEHIEVGVPADEAFSLWTQYEAWSRIFKNESASEGRKRVPEGRRAGREVKVRAKIGPSERRWTAVVSGVEPGHRINWRSRGALQAIGTTSFHRLDDRLTKVMVEVEYHPKGLVEKVGNLLRLQRRRVRQDLRLFKNYAELRGIGDGDQGSASGAEQERS